MSSRTVKRQWRQRTGMNTTPSYILLPEVSSSLHPLQPILSSALSLALTSTGMTAEHRPLLQTQCLCSCSPLNQLLQSAGAVLLCPQQRILQRAQPLGLVAVPHLGIGWVVCQVWNAVSCLCGFSGASMP